MDKEKILSAIQEMQAVYDDPKTPLDIRENIGAALTKAKEQYAEYERDPHGQKRLVEDCHEILRAIREHVFALDSAINKGLHAMYARQVAEHGIIITSNVRPKVDDQTFQDDFIIFDFKTQYFNECPAAVSFFNKIMLIPSSIMYKALILVIAKDVDNLLGIQKAAKKSGIPLMEFEKAIAYVIRASFFLNPLISGITDSTDNINDYYPIFLSEILITIAEKIVLPDLKEKVISPRQRSKTQADFKATEKAIQEVGGDIIPESVNWMTFDLNGRRYEIIQKDSEYQLNMLSYFDDVFEKKVGESQNPAELIHMAIERKEDGGPVRRDRHPGLTYVGMDDPQVNSLSDFDLDAVNDTLSNDENSTDADIIARFVDDLDMDQEQAQYLVTTYRPQFFREPLFQLDKGYTDDQKAAGSRMKSDTLSPKAQETYDRYMTDYKKGKTAEKKRQIRNEIMVNPFPQKRASAIHFEGYRKFLDDTRHTKVKGGKVGFAEKVKAIEKNLEGKPVPKKYRSKQTGKRYTKKTATKAATKIAGAQVKKERKKGGRKMLLGGIALHTPPSISLMGDQDNLSIHGAG